METDDGQSVCGPLRPIRMAAIEAISRIEQVEQNWAEQLETQAAEAGADDAEAP